MKRIVLAVGLAAIGITSIAADASAQWRRGRDRVVIERANPGINASTLAVILAIQAAKRAAREDTTVIRDRSREFVPLK